MKRLPPKEKIYEALTAVADGRVSIKGDPSLAQGEATVTSSDAARTYDVSWEMSTYSSTDPGTYWQGYPGYPVIAVLMLQGKLPYDTALARALGGVKWKDVNARHKNDYAAAVEEVLGSHGIDAAAASAVVQGIYSDLERLPIAISRSRLRKV